MNTTRGVLKTMRDESMSQLEIEILPEVFAIVALPPGDDWPRWASSGPLVSITRTGDELSVVCLESEVPPRCESAGGWRCLRLRGPFELDTVGVLASLAAPLAKAGVPVFVVSTFRTDCLLVHDELLDRARDALESAGHIFIN